VSAIALHNDAARLEVRPELGGALTAFEFAGRPVFRRTPPGATDAAETSAFVLAPFPNRIAQARFVFGGRVIALAPDPAGGAHALHGGAWRRPWTVERTGPAELRMATSDLGDWPWACRVVQDVRLRPDGLDVDVSLINLDATPMPAGLGWHPAFAARDVCRIQLDCGMYYPTSDDLPTAPRALEPHWTFADGVDGAALAPIDHCLRDWSGAAELVWPDRKIRLTARGCPFLQVYAPTHGSFVCLEPQTCAPDAFNRDASFGASSLAPGEALEIQVRIDVEDL
jgi:aldose 1-epimerase